MNRATTNHGAAIETLEWGFAQRIALPWGRPVVLLLVAIVGLGMLSGCAYRQSYVLANRAALSNERGDHASALKDATDAVALFPHNGYAYFHRAWAKRVLGMPAQEVLADLDCALDKSRTSMIEHWRPAYETRARLRYAVGLYDGAADDCDEALNPWRIYGIEELTRRNHSLELHSNRPIIYVPTEKKGYFVFANDRAFDLVTLRLDAAQKAGRQPVYGPLPRNFKFSEYRKVGEKWVLEEH